MLLHPGRSSEAQHFRCHAYGRYCRGLRGDAYAGDPCGRDSRREHGGVGRCCADSCAVRELPSGGAAVFTESGAFKAHALDLCDRVGLELPELSSRRRKRSTGALPAFIPPSNPLDLTAQGLVDPDLYRRTLPPILDEDRFGSVLLGIILTDPKTTRLKLPPIVDAIRSLTPRKPVVFAALDEGAPFDFPELRNCAKLGWPAFHRRSARYAHWPCDFICIAKGRSRPCSAGR